MSEPDAIEQQQGLTGGRPAGATPGVRTGVPEADAVEQAQEVDPTEDAETGDLPLEVDGADAAEQAAVVPQDEDEHR